jgi:hypothetical protein
MAAGEVLHDQTGDPRPRQETYRAGERPDLGWSAAGKGRRGGKRRWGGPPGKESPLQTPFERRREKRVREKNR